MKHGFEIVRDIAGLIDIDEIRSKITGKVWKIARPNNSPNIDIVVGLLNASNGAIQEADVNIRIHAPNIEIENRQSGDFSTLDKLTSLVLPYVETQSRYSFWTEVSIPGEIYRDADGTYFSLIRVIYRSYQSNYKNI